MQRVAEHPSVPTTPPALADGRVAMGAGRPLDPAIRTFFEDRFGHDFRQVRVHTGAEATRSTKAVRALALTVGSDIVFGANRYAPATMAGRRLLAHELTHVVQQRAATGTPLLQRQAQGVDSAAPEAPSGILFPSCEDAPPQPDGQPPALDRWIENETLKRIRAEAPGENHTLLSRARRSRGEAVQLVQQAILSFGCEQRDQNLLPRFGADGIFGAETQRAVEAFQDGRTTRDGIVGPLTLGELDKVVIPAAETRRGGDAGEGKEVKAPPARSIRTDPLKARIKSVTMRPPTNIRVVRLASRNDQVQETLDRPFDFDATVNLSPGPELAGVRFGFFQLGRPFEQWRVTYRDIDAKPGASGADLNRDETFPLRSQLPARDHVSAFYPLPTGGQPTPVTPATTQVKVGFRDRPLYLFDDMFSGIPGRVFRLSGIVTETFFFTALGLITPGGQALLLQTFYWTVRHCEEIGPNLFKTVIGSPIVLRGPVDCLRGDCHEGEPGADTFGSSGGKSFGAIVADTLPTYGGGNAKKPPAGPGDFKVPCAK